MDHEHSSNGPDGCKLCAERRTGDFGQGSREQSFRGLGEPKVKEVRAARG